MKNPTTLSVDALRGLPSQTQAVTLQSDEGAQSHTYVGVPLFDIVTAAAPVVDSEHASLSVVIAATGADGYSAAVSLEEISPEFAATPVLVADTEDGQELDRPRLVVPGDIKGGRYISDLTELRVVNLAHQAFTNGRADRGRTERTARLLDAQDKAAELFAEIEQRHLSFPGSRSERRATPSGTLRPTCSASTGTGTSASSGPARTRCSPTTRTRLTGSSPKTTWCSATSGRSSRVGRPTSDAPSSWATTPSSTGYATTCLSCGGPAGILRGPPRGDRRATVRPRGAAQ